MFDDERAKYKINAMTSRNTKEKLQHKIADFEEDLLASIEKEKERLNSIPDTRVKIFENEKIVENDRE